MKELKASKKLVYDGDISGMTPDAIEVEYDGFKVKVDSERLVSIGELDASNSGLEIDKIIINAGFRITNFGSKNIYHGSKQGLKLFYILENIDEKAIYFIFSFGEFQPGRFICIFEGVLVDSHG